MSWSKLVDYKEAAMRRGSILRFPANYPFEDIVAMMICELRVGDQQFGLVTVSGFKAGINPYVAFPNECLINTDSIGLSTDWLIKNWKKWVWPDGDVNDVFVREELHASEL